ncbi:MAG: hypothetical protein BGO78_00905 [Chloroflexi bacterium 44-23]|nr:MAG: hypothetical protein BGO78_00905 [Chloroflexi bacterium 44-23]
MSEIISSTSNARIKSIRKLRGRKQRDEQQVFFVEGVRIVGEALAEGWPIVELIISPELVGDGYGRHLISEMSHKKINQLVVDSNVFRSISTKDGPKGLAAVICQRWYPVDFILTQPGLWICLDRIQDPGNLGTIMRTADAVGAKGLILIDECTDPYDSGSVRSSMGAIFSIPLIKTTNQDFQAFVLRNHLPVIGASDSAPLDFRLVNYAANMILMMGSERQGLSEPLVQLSTHLVSIPMAGKSDSLNLAVATGIILYEIYNQNHPAREG